MGRERRRPLRSMLGVTPASLVTGDVSCGTVFERHRLCRVELRLPPFSPPHIDRVNAVVPLQSKLGRPLARLNKADGVKRSQAHPTGTAIQHEPKHPILRPIFSDAQIEPTPVGVHARVPLLVHLQRGEPANWSRHSVSTVSPQIGPHSTCGLWRTAMNV